MKGPYIFLGLSLILAIYIFINGSKKQRLITIATIVGCFLMCFNLTAESIKIGFLTVLLFVSSYLIGVLYAISLFIYKKIKILMILKRRLLRE
jgi:hypothetical protein